MNLIPYNFFIYLNYLICGCWIVLPWVFNQTGSINQTNIFLSLLGVILFFVLASSKQVSFPKTEFIDVRIVVLVLFVHAIVLAFFPYIFAYTSNTALFRLTYILAAIELVSILLSKIDIADKSLDS
jgi:hypothetical protein